MVLISTSVLLSMSSWLASSVVLEHLAAKYSVSLSTAALLTAAVQAGFMLCALGQTLTMLPDRVSCQLLMGAGALSAAAVNVALFYAPTFYTALLCRLLTGACMALVYPPSTKVLSTWFVTQRGLAMSFLVGSIAPGSAMPDLIKAMPVGDLWQTDQGFWYLTLFTSGLSVLGGLIPLCLVPNAR